MTEVNLPPLINIIRGCNETYYRCNRAVIENTRPQTKGMRSNPYDNIVLHHTAGVGIGTSTSDVAIHFIADPCEGSSLYNEMVTYTAELEERIVKLEEQMAKLMGTDKLKTKQNEDN